MQQLLDVPRAAEALSSVIITRKERESVLLVPQLFFARDLHALDKASVVFLMELSRPESEADICSSGSYVYGDYGAQWREKMVGADRL